MLIDITLKIIPKMVKDTQGNEMKSLVGHLGTHFDVMHKEFPLEYVECKGIVFDVSNISDRDISECDIDINKVEKDMFVAFYTGFIEKEGYGSKKYFSEHPQLSNELIDVLLSRSISIIGVEYEEGVSIPLKTNTVLKKEYLLLKIYVILKRFFKNRKVRILRRTLIL